LPLNAIGSRYENYAEAICALDKPTKFEDNLHYRLLRIAENELHFSLIRTYRYFDKIKYGDYLLFDLASISKDNAPFGDSQTHAVWCDLEQPEGYIVLAGISTLTLIHSGDHLRMLMHLRGREETAYAVGTHHVIPAGEFQPSCQAPSSFGEDCDLWRSIMREYAEEIGAMDEYDGNSTVPFDYSMPPFDMLDAEKACGNIKAYYLGTGLDPITLQAEIMTVVVFKEEVFQEIFPKIVEKNSEGRIITERNRWGKIFSRAEIDSYTDNNTLASAQSLLNLAWLHRETFENCFVRI
jgi:hypothetical protein